MEHYDTAIKTLMIGGRFAPRLYAMAIPDAFFHADAAYPWLNEEEAVRLRRMAGPRRRAQFAAGRLLLRRALQRTCGAEAARARLRLVNGAPRLDAAEHGAAPVVSLSHSGEIVMCAVAERGALGVDVERCVPRRLGWDALAERALHPVERARLSALPEPARWQGFYRAWTLKEALAKALGVGLALPFDRIAFSGDLRVEAAPDGCGVTDCRWDFAAPDMGEAMMAAVAWSAG